jgi:hypothetical protein
VPAFLRRPRAVAAAIIGGAFLLATPLLLGPVVDVVRDAIDDQRTRAAWPAQRAAIELALDRVDLGAPFALVSCPDDGLGAVQCWQYDGMPADAVPSLAAALTAAAVADVVTDCDEAVRAPDGGAAACHAGGTVGGRGLALVASRDLEPGSPTSSERFAATSTIMLLANLTEP